jgi:cation:H+ antiporter
MWRHGREGGESEPLPGGDMVQLQTKLLGGRSRAMALTIEVGLVLLGIAAVVAGGAFLVRGAIELATTAGISQTVIGLTVVAIGTSLPELATSLVAAYRRQSDIAYGNVVGSTIFNILGIGGVTALTVPVEVPQHILLIDLPIMIAVIVLMAIFVATGSRITRGEGAVLITGYGAYLASLAALAP